MPSPISTENLATGTTASKILDPFIPKKYQQDPASGGGVLDSVEAFFKACRQQGRASLAFTAVTEDLWGRGLPYRPLKNFPPGTPYFCLRVPTGGGKTWLAAKSVALVNAHLLWVPHSVVLWLVPSGRGA